MLQGLAFKLVVALTLLTAVTKGVFGYFNVKEEERHFIRNMVLGADQLSQSIASATWKAMQADRRDAAYEIMETIATKQGIDRIRILNKEGRVMFSTGPDRGAMVDRKAEACFLCHAREKPLVRVDVPSRARVFHGPDGHRKLGIVTPLYNEPACSSASCHAHPETVHVLGVLDVDLDLRQVDRDLADIRTRTILLGFAQVLLIALFIFTFTRRFVQVPILKLIEGTKAVSALDLDRSIEIDSSAEFQALASSFNDMRERLKKAAEENARFTRNLETMVAEENAKFIQSLETTVQERTRQLQLAEQRLIRSDRLASLGQLAATVAHEINNPVAGVLNLGTLMQRIVTRDGIPPDRIEEFQSYLDLVVAETSRVGRVVSDLLSFSRQVPPHRGPIDLNEVVRNTVSLLNHKFELSGAKAELDLQEDLLEVFADGSQMQQVLVNLLSNAVESVQQGGVVSVSTRGLSEKQAVALEVRDTGAGIRGEDLSKIFDPFFTTKGEGKGVGLGLAVVYGIVHSHGGDIEVDSQVNQGTTFRVTLPTGAQGAAVGLREERK
ncbi:MAG: hypothetical protein A3F84_27875 [Candidatus Handelsmanbacteria bacterium RIFCSPLOWO2_12_FULL_64_10]|uniref:histidine kinase n=1 Tax=Handelsmanbacteria sp. (strain RIFCSPLOWO2_12_FULL_64_10) TaxID=1817868 RepID=A0A1F6C489_HANXR|nr:MAG: hypothetical protein A3F84_27875 [Candidatus Handelsmanbacteria bacterium RIFCSPLOWO2_12_FULL_64_10]